jgi:hypothetical protein
MAEWVQQGTVRRRKSVTLDSNGNGTVSFGVDWSSNHKWVINSVIVATNQSPTTAPYPTATVYVGGQQVGVSEGATWTGNQDTFSGVAEMTADDLNVAFTGGVPGSVATAIIEGDSYLWTRKAEGNGGAG